MTAVIVLAVWSGLALAGCLALHRARQSSPPQEVVNWLPYLPPVPSPLTPPFSQTVASADWFRDMPSDCLGDEAIRILADDIAANFRVIDGAQ